MYLLNVLIIMAKYYIHKTKYVNKKQFFRFFTKKLFCTFKKILKAVKTVTASLVWHLNFIYLFFSLSVVPPGKFKFIIL